MKKTLNWQFVLCLVIVMLIGWVLWTRTDALTRADIESKKERDAYARRLDAADAKAERDAAALDALARQVRRAGEVPVVDPDDLPERADQVTIIEGTRGPRGFIGPVGPSGKPGRDGAPGVDGLAGKDGAVGPAGAQGPQGPPGADGKDGAAGKDGRGLKSTTCTDGRWVVTYTDATSEDAGPCWPPVIPPTE